MSDKVEKTAAALSQLVAVALVSGIAGVGGVYATKAYKEAGLGPVREWPGQAFRWRDKQFAKWIEIKPDPQLEALRTPVVAPVDFSRMAQQWQSQTPSFPTAGPYPQPRVITPRRW